MPLPGEDIEGSLNLVINTFKELRPELLIHFGTIDHVSKGDGSPVTNLDIKVESTLKKRLAQHYPHIGFHGEETGDVAGSSDATWIIDPIDGTSSFVHGLPYCTNMAGLVVDGETVAGIVYQFVSDDLYIATKGGGAYKNGKRLSIKNTALDDTIIFSGSFVYKNLYDIFKQYKMGLYAPIGASGYEFTRLAEGSIQGVTKLRCGSQIHDDVPGVLIAREAGAEVVSFEGSAYTYDTLQFVIGTPNFADVIKKHQDEIAHIIAI